MLKEAGGGAAAQHHAYSPLLPDNLASSAQVRSWGCGDDGRTWTACGIAVWAIWSWWVVGLQDARRYVFAQSLVASVPASSRGQGDARIG
jgi:hypothetical protein